MTVFLNHTNILIDLYEHNTHQFDIKRVAFDLIRKELAYHISGDNHNSFALESSERFHLSTARSWVNVGLVQNVVPSRFQFMGMVDVIETKLDIWLIKFCCRDSATLPSPLCGEVKDLVETLCALLDQLVPSSGVVALSAQPVHLHLLD